MDMLEDFELQLLEALRKQKENYCVPARPIFTVCPQQLNFITARWTHCRLVNFWSVRLFNIVYMLWKGCSWWSSGSLVYVLVGKLSSKY